MTDRRPNIIFLMDDQHRWDAMGCVNPLVKTPALDSLAAEGVRYEQAVCQAPACVPSRYSMMLGLYPSQVGVRTNSDWLTDAQLPLPTLAERLRDAGYFTAGFGKTHWKDPDCSTRGFDVRFIGSEYSSGEKERGAVMMADEKPEALERYRKEVEPFGMGGQKVAGYVGRTSELPSEDHPDGWLAGKCVEFLDKPRDASKPLFLYLSFNRPHVGFNVPRGFEDMYNPDDIPDMDMPQLTEEIPGHIRKSDGRMPCFKDASPEVRRGVMLRYWANCSWIDSLFGGVLAKLRETGALENSLIVYVSDHGDMMGDRHFRFAKFCLYEGSVRSPLILAGSALPPELRATVDRRPAELVDIMPTILGVAGLPGAPELVGESLLAPSTRGGSFAEHHYAPPAYMWRTPQAKLIHYSVKAAGGGREARGELYDLEADPKERVNLYDDPAHAGLQERMTRALLMHLCESRRRHPHKSDMHTNPMTD